jgi:hypothetical protein
MATDQPTAAAPPVSITPALAEFLESGLIMYIATRSATMKPSNVGAAGLRVEGPTTITVFLPDAVSATALGDLADNRQISVELVKVTDARAVQIKGELLEISAASDADQVFQEDYRARLMPELAQVGMPRSTVSRLVFWPARALRVAVKALFLQTPGAQAGRPLEAGAASLLQQIPGGRSA